MSYQDRRIAPQNRERFYENNLQAHEEIDDDHIDGYRANIELYNSDVREALLKPGIENSLVDRSVSFSSRNFEYKDIMSQFTHYESKRKNDKLFYPDLNFLFKVLSDLEFNCLPPKAGTTSMHPLLPRIYFGTLAILMIQRAFHKGSGTFMNLPRDDLIKEFFLDSGFIHSIMIPTPLVPIFKALNAQRLKCHLDSALIPTLGHIETLSTRHALETTFQSKNSFLGWMGIPDIHEMYLLFSRFNLYTTELPPQITYAQFRHEDVVWKRSTLVKYEGKELPLDEFHNSYDLHNLLKEPFKHVFCRAGFNYSIKGAPDRNITMQNWKDILNHSKEMELNPKNLRNFLHLNSFTWFQKLINEMNNHYSCAVKTIRLSECLDYKSFSNSVVYYKLNKISSENIIPELFNNTNDLISRVYEDNPQNVSEPSLALARQSFLHTTFFDKDDKFARMPHEHILRSKESPFYKGDCSNPNKIIVTDDQSKLAVEHEIIAEIFK